MGEAVFHDNGTCGKTVSFIDRDDNLTIGVGIRYGLEKTKAQYQVYSCTEFLGYFNLEEEDGLESALRAVEVAFYG